MAAVPPTQSQAVLWQLKQGNNDYIAARDNAPEKPKGRLVDALVEDPLWFNPKPPNALVVSCARSYVSPDAVFSAQPGELQHVRVCGNVCGTADGTVAAVEAAVTSRRAPPLVVVMGNSDSQIIELAMQRSIARLDSPGAQLPPMWKAITEELRLLKSVIISADDALLKAPKATLREQSIAAVKFNVWRSIEYACCHRHRPPGHSALTPPPMIHPPPAPAPACPPRRSLLSSPIIADRVRRGQLEVYGAFFDVTSGRVSLNGRHPSERLLVTRCAPRRSSNPGLPTAVPPTMASHRATPQTLAPSPAVPQTLLDHPLPPLKAI